MSRQAYANAQTYADEPSGSLKIADAAEVSVFLAGTETLATLYEARLGGATLSNPMILDSDAMLYFWADTGDYDIKVHDTVGPARFGDFTFGWQSSPTNTEIEVGDLSNEGDIQWTQDLGGAWIPQLQSNSVTAAEIAPDAVGASEIAENAVGAAEILTGAVGELEVSDGAVTSRKLKPTTGLLRLTEKLVLKEAYQDAVGLKLEITPSVASILQVTVTASFFIKASTGVKTNLLVDGVEQEDRIEVSGPSNNFPVAMGVQTYRIPLTAAAHTIKVQGRMSSEIAEGSLLTKATSGGSNMAYTLFSS